MFYYILYKKVGKLKTDSKKISMVIILPFMMTEMSDAFMQNGGSEDSYEYDCDSEDEIKDDTPIIGVRRNTRSFVVRTITEYQYNKVKDNINWLWNGDRSTSRSGGLVVNVYGPGEEIVFPRELITTNDYQHPGRTICHSTTFTDDVLEEYPLDVNSYRMVGIDMIWCRENELMDQLRKVM